MLAAIVGVISSIAGVITSLAGLALAIKLILLGIFTLVLPIILKNVFLWIMDTTLNLASQSTGGFQSFTYQATGLGAYMADHMQLPLCLSIILTAVSVRFILRSMRIL